MLSTAGENFKVFWGGLPVISDKKIHAEYPDCLITFTYDLLLFFSVAPECIVLQIKSNPLITTFPPLWSITIAVSSRLLMIRLCQRVHGCHTRFQRGHSQRCEWLDFTSTDILTLQSALGWKPCSVGCQMILSLLCHHGKVLLCLGPPAQ